MDQEEFEIEIKREFIIEATEMLEETETAFLDLENDPDDVTILDRIFRLAHTIKGSAYAAGFSDLAEFAHVFETLLGKLRNDEISVDSKVVDVLLDSNDYLIKFVKTIELDSNASLDTEEAKNSISELIADCTGVAIVQSKDDDTGGLHLFDEEQTAEDSHPTGENETEKDVLVTWEGTWRSAKDNAEPLADQASEEEFHHEKIASVKARHTVLILDDEPGIVQLMRDLIDDLGHKVETAGNGIEGLKVLENAMVDLILCDVKMPEMDGPTFVKKVRESDENIPIIFISGAADRKEVLLCLNLGAYGLVEKPFNEDTLELLITNALKMKTILDAVVKLSSLNFRAYIASTKISKMTANTPEADKKRAKANLEHLLDEIASLTNLILDSRMREAS